MSDFLAAGLCRHQGIHGPEDGIRHGFSPKEGITRACLLSALGAKVTRRRPDLSAQSAPKAVAEGNNKGRASKRTRLHFDEALQPQH
jgi:hypothetical protein